MNLALKDTLHAPTRFALTALGVAFLVMAVIGMTGLYRGIVEDALLIIDRIDADLWIVQGERAGPFAEGSAVAADMDRRVEGVQGVADVRRFTQFSQQFNTCRQFASRHRDWRRYTARRRSAGVTTRRGTASDTATNRYEAVADTSTGLKGRRPYGTRA